VNHKLPAMDVREDWRTAAKQATIGERVVPALILGAIGVTCIISMMAIPWAFFSILWIVPTFVVLWLALAVYAGRKGPRSVAAMILVPAAVFAMALLPTPARSLSRWLADVADVAAFRGDLLRQMNTLHDNAGGEHIVVVILQGFGSLTSGLAYDPSRGLDNPSRATNPQWRSAFEATELSLPDAEIRHVVGPYYSWFHP
jgi:hypothetical protein